MATWMKQTATEALSAVQPMPTIDSVEAWSFKNAGLMAQTLVLAAVSHGIGTCVMEGYDVRRARRILRIPERYGVPLMVVMGYDYEEGRGEEVKRTPRLEEREVVFGDVFGEALDWGEEEEDDGGESSSSGKMPADTPDKTVI